MSRMLPYPGRYESHDSWMRRCDSWERERNMWNNCRSTNWGGYNYRAVQGPKLYSTPEGTKLPALKVYPSRSKMNAAISFAEKTGGCFVVMVSLGNPNLITSREDFIVIRHCDLPALTKDCTVLTAKHAPYASGFWIENRRQEVYSNDNH